jgi:hypothetical protein
MPFRVTSISRRAWWAAVAAVGAGLLMTVIVAEPDRTWPAGIPLMLVLALLIGMGARGMRSATLIATPYRVTVRELARTTHWTWPIIEGFVADTRPTQVPWLPVIRVRRRVLGVVYSGGRTRWLHELSCPARDGASTWVDATAAQLSGLLAAPPGDAGQCA